MRRSDLPDVSNIADGLRLGRSPRDGYARGYGLEFDALSEKIALDPLYRSASALAEGRSIQSERNRMNLFLLLRFFARALPRGDIVEFGSYRGGSAIFMARVAQELLPGTRVFAFDTFSGIPYADRAIDQHTAGDFNDVDFEELSSFVADAQLSNLHLIRGRFEETAPSAIGRIAGIRLCHVDCDVREAVAFSYETARPKMVPGGYMVFDDALYSTCLGATEAVEELVIRRDGLHSEQVYPHFVFRIWNGAEPPA